jgi:hypothetical protein
MEETGSLVGGDYLTQALAVMTALAAMEKKENWRLSSCL